jgi:hypothetical protein
MTRSYRHLWSAHWRIKSAIYWSKSSTVYFILNSTTSSLRTQNLVVIEPLLIDEDYYARVEGREIISNLSKAAGLAHMISTMRPDIDHADEYVRNTTARAFSVVASALDIPSLLPFLKAVKKIMAGSSHWYSYRPANRHLLGWLLWPRRQHLTVSSHSTRCRSPEDVRAEGNGR